MAQESDVWLAGLYDLLVKSGCFDLGCPFVIHGEPGDDGRPPHIVIAHSKKIRLEVAREVVTGLGRIETLGITTKLIGQLREAHRDGDVSPAIEVEDATASS